MSSDLTLPFSGDISKDELINNVSCVMINNEEKSIDQTLGLMSLRRKIKI